ncbi:hypothetical protein PFISCL1PPCAC_9230, partial [Pristionchus fissidentatus]
SEEARIVIYVPNPKLPPKPKEEQESIELKELKSEIYMGAGDLWRLRGCPERPQQKVTIDQENFEDLLRHESLIARIQHYLLRYPESGRLHKALEMAKEDFTY